MKLQLAHRVGRRRVAPREALGARDLLLRGVERDLVDELNLMIEPIVLGGGKGIFPDDGAARTFELVSAQTTATGVQVCRYQPTR